MFTTAERTAKIPLAAPLAFFRIQDGATKTVRLYQATLTGAAERPTAVDTPAIGRGMLIVDGTRATWVVSYSGLKGDATAAHVHGPAKTWRAE